jgi:poly-gamma-glutamate synthesis protein (capsule biosynthesis protein)
MVIGNLVTNSQNTMQRLIIKNFLLLIVSSLFLSGCAKNIPNQSVTIENVPADSGKEEIASQDVKEPIRILFVGDMMFDRHIREAVGKYGGGNYNYPLASLKEKLAEYDLVVGNLEGPITDNKSVSAGTKIGEGKNFVFTFDPAVASVLVENNIKIVNLGNNHILNQGAGGVEQTKKRLDAAGVQYFGDTGYLEAKLPLGSLASKSISFVGYNYSESGSEEGAVENIKLAKEKSDLVIVCPHWGTEYKTGDPGPAVRNTARKFADAGADAVIGTHPHVVQASEEYNGKKIYFSLGNFVFDQYFQEETMEGLGVEMTIEPDGVLEYSELKFEMTKRGQTLFKAGP